MQKVVGSNPIIRSKEKLVRARVRSGLIDDTEAVAVRVDENHKVVFRPGFPLVAGCAQSQQALNLACSIVGVEVEVHAAHLAQRWRVLNAIERDVRTAPGWVGEYDQPSCGGASGR